MNYARIMRVVKSCRCITFVLGDQIKLLSSLYNSVRRFLFSIVTPELREVRSEEGYAAIERSSSLTKLRWMLLREYYDAVTFNTMWQEYSQVIFETEQ